MDLNCQLSLTAHVYIYIYWNYCLNIVIQAGVTHIVLAVSYRAELLEKEMREQEQRVSIYKFLLMILDVSSSNIQGGGGDQTDQTPHRFSNLRFEAFKQSKLNFRYL